MKNSEPPRQANRELHTNNCQLETEYETNNLTKSLTNSMEQSPSWEAKMS